jgi:GT2 family glycosyltransferase
MSFKFGVIILNYLAWEETIDCVNCFLKYKDNHSVQIVIVDNHSTNDSIKFLSEEYANNPCVDILKLDKNYGFANGNNKGYFFLRDNYDCDYYVFSNSDILFEGDVFSWIIKQHNKIRFNVLGPDIYAKKLGYHQNPLKNYTENVALINLKIIYKEFQIFKNLIFKVLNIKWRDICTSKKSVGECNKDELHINVTLHGSFIVADKSYFNYYEDFFDPNTFLYMEEHLLYQRCKRANLMSVVSYDFNVKHLQGVSTDKLDPSIYKKKNLRLQNEIKSLKIYKNIIKKQL